MRVQGGQHRLLTLLLEAAAGRPPGSGPEDGRHSHQIRGERRRGASKEAKQLRAHENSLLEAYQSTGGPFPIFRTNQVNSEWTILQNVWARVWHRIVFDAVYGAPRSAESTETARADL